MPPPPRDWSIFGEVPVHPTHSPGRLSSQLSSSQSEEDSSFLTLSSCCKSRADPLPLAPWTFQWPFHEPPMAICPSWAASSRPAIDSVPGGARPRVWTGPSLLSMLFFNFPAQYFLDFFDNNKCFIALPPNYDHFGPHFLFTTKRQQAGC